jgi:signal transduction histidine kinase
MAHELNNPAAAAAGGAKVIRRAIDEVSDAAEALGSLGLTLEQRDAVRGVGRQRLESAVPGTPSPIERADLEDRLSQWLEARGLGAGATTGLLDGGIDVEVLDELERAVPPAALPAAVRWIATALSAQGVALDLERATRRIDELVSMLRRFTYMDRAAVREPIDPAPGLSDTVALLRQRARTRSVSLSLSLAEGLPRINAVGSDLNLAWSNLVENAIDAVGDGGRVEVAASLQGGDVIVRVIDDGPGIPPDVQDRMFDLFFTTKPQGQGTGLGLDLVRRVVHEHGGDVSFETRPGRTEFRVRLPGTGTAPPVP